MHMLVLSSSEFEIDFPHHVRFAPDSDQTADIAGGPFRAISADGRMPAFCALRASAKVEQAPSATKNCPVNNSTLLEAIADRLQVGAEEFDECAVELLVKLRPV
jgi:hypothetical protein